MTASSNNLLEEKRILIADDDDIYLFSASYAINRYYPGFEIVTSRNGEDALERIYQMKISALFMDLDMPLMNGWELLDALQIKYNHPPFPIIVSSATRATSDLEKLKSHPFVFSFIQKPLTEDNLKRLNLLL